MRLRKTIIGAAAGVLLMPAHATAQRGTGGDRGLGEGRDRRRLAGRYGRSEQPRADREGPHGRDR
jgi:hypothetical protein